VEGTPRSFQAEELVALPEAAGPELAAAADEDDPAS
jgi:hypothetical protein